MVTQLKNDKDKLTFFYSVFCLGCFSHEIEDCYTVCNNEKLQKRVTLLHTLILSAHSSVVRLVFIVIKS